jgi:murein DD-endopeptidase MepM/ murein hydrolase activator NlpD
MPTERDHRRAQKKRYTVVLLPESEVGTPRRITMGRGGFFAIGFLAILLLVAAVIGLMVYTPLGLYVPIENPELENRYQRQIVAIQKQLAQVTDDLMWLREYNVRLRKALGENIPDSDSTFVAARPLEFQDDSHRREMARGEMRQDADPGRVPFASEIHPTSGMLVKAIEAEFPMTVPTTGYVTQEFDIDKQHFGIDFAGKEGSNVYAAADGSVIFAGWTYEDGYMIMLVHGNGYRTTYKHNQTLLKNRGEFVRRGEPIALLGNSGKLSYGPHLHFEVWRDAIPQDPRKFLLTVQ